MIDWILDEWYRFWVIVAIIIGIFIWTVVKLEIADNARWQKYSQEHHCVIKGIKQGQTGVGFGPTSNGQTTFVTTTTPDQTIYICDGGEMVIR